MDQTPRTRRISAVGIQGLQQPSLARLGVQDAAEKEKLLKEMLQEKKEDEVRFADIEGRLREFVLEVVKPTISRNTKLQQETENMQNDLRIQGSKLQTVVDSMKDLQERSDAIVSFQTQIDGFSERGLVLEEKLMEVRLFMMAKLEKTEQLLEAQKSTATRLGRGLERVVQDMDGFTNNIKELQDAVDLCGLRSREHLEGEIRRVDGLIQEVKDMHHSFAKEVWGLEDSPETTQPSLRRLDLQMRKFGETLQKAMTDLLELRRLDGEMGDAKQRLQGIFEKTDDLSGKTSDLQKRIDKIALDTKADAKRVSNLMAAFTANLMQDVRVGFSYEVKGLQEAHQEMQRFVQATQVAVNELEVAVESTGKQVEVSMRQCRNDIDLVDSRRRKDKQGFEEGMSQMQARVSSSFEASEATLQGLEHLANVLRMSLQSEKMSTALDQYHFADQKDTPYVGAHGIVDKRRGGPRKAGGIDPETLFRLTYQPQPITFQGASFERQQLIGLREKLVDAAQEALLRGPSGVPGKLPAHLVGLGAAQRLGHDEASGRGGEDPRKTTPDSEKSESGRHSVPLVPRPGSRGQPSARGTPVPHGEENTAKFGTITPPIKSVAGADEFLSKDTTESPGSGGAAVATRLPSLGKWREPSSTTRPHSTATAAPLTAR